MEFKPLIDYAAKPNRRRNIEADTMSAFKAIIAWSAVGACFMVVLMLAGNAGYFNQIGDWKMNAVEILIYFGLLLPAAIAFWFGALGFIAWTIREPICDVARLAGRAFKSGKGE